MNWQKISYIALLPCLLLFFQNCSHPEDSSAVSGTAPSLQGDIGDLLEGASTNKTFCADVSSEIAQRSGPKILVSPARPGRVTVDGQETSLRNVVASAAEGSIIVLADGTYNFDEANSGGSTGLYFATPNITMVGNASDSSKVILDSKYADHGGQTGVITIDSANVTLAHFTVKNSIFHLVHLQGDADGAQVHDVRLMNGGQQFLKGSPGVGQIDDGSVTCSHFSMDANGRANVWGYGEAEGSTTCSTGGIDTHDANHWVVSDNTFLGIYCDETLHPAHGKKGDDRGHQTYRNGLAEFAVHMRNSEQGTSHTIERNRIINCARGIGLGVNDTSTEYGGVIRNNYIFNQHPGTGQHDVGIFVGGVKNAEVYNNTIFFSSSNAYPNAVEARFDFTTDVRVVNNLLNKNIQMRNGATGIVENNVTNAQVAWFENVSSGNLHLARCDIDGIHGASLPEANLLYDFDLDERPTTFADIGADQCRP